MGTAPATENRLEIRPQLPFLAGLFDLPGEAPIVSHEPHEPHDHLKEHLHEHLHHMHISYGFKIPAQAMPSATKLEVAMSVLKDLRVDCNPIFVNRVGREGVLVKIANQDVHWVHSEEVAQKATSLFAKTGRFLPEECYFSGFRSSDVDEREEYSYTGEEMQAAVGQGLVAEQHFQATWREPRNEPIAPFDVVIYLGDSASSYHTFFKLPVVAAVGA